MTEKIKQMVKDQGHTLLYLTQFGSHLYGLNTPNSDTDYKGIFLPNKDAMLLGKPSKHMKYNTTKENTPNTSDDIDIELWSLQYWLEMVRKGDTGAIDLLFSYTNMDVIVYAKSVFIDFVMHNYHKLFQPNKMNAYVGYCIGQAKKYGIKGSRLSVIKTIKEFLDQKEFAESDTLADHIEELIENFGDSSYCFTKKIKDIDFLFVCGKQHQFTIKMDEFYQRIKMDYNRYGERSKLAEQNQGVDWKALSHAARCLFQMEDILENGKIVFPFTGTRMQILKDIKQGKKSWQEVEDFIINGLETVDYLQETYDKPNTYDPKVAETFILLMYP